MKRWPVIVLVVMALVVLVSPGLIGKLAEESLDDSITWTEADSPGVNITTEKFERGWFTSVGRHRIELDSGQFREATERFRDATGASALPSLIVDTRLDHGLVPVTSLGRNEGSISPGLASNVSTFVLDFGNDEVLAVPGALYSEVSLTGGSNAHLLLEPGSFEKNRARLEWQGTDLEIGTYPAAGERTIEGDVSALRLETDELTAGFQSLTINAEQAATGYGFNTGNAEIHLSELVFGNLSAPVSVAVLGIIADSEIDDRRVSGTSVLEIAKLAAPTGEVVNVAVKLSFAKIDAQSLGDLSAAMEDAPVAKDPEAALMNIVPRIDPELQSLVRHGFEFDIERFEVSFPQGDASMSFRLDVAATDDSTHFSWPAVLLNTKASLDLRLPVELFELVLAMYPEASSLLALGLLQRDGDDYAMDADYAKGLINVNGAPMPIPMPGF